MRRALLALTLAAAVTAAVASAPAQAGSACNAQPLRIDQFHKASTMAFKLRDRLEAMQAKVAIVGRIGSDLSEHGLRYSHAGFIQRDHTKGKWIFVHALNRCATSRSAVFDEGLINFFLDDPYRYEAVVMVPTPELQQRLGDVLAGPLVRRLHHPPYSMIAYPFGNRYQNSNQWLLALVAAAQDQQGYVSNRFTAQQALSANGYRGDIIYISSLDRLGASLFRANVRFDDHPRSSRNQGRFEVVTVRSIIRYMHATDPGTRVEVVRLR